MCNIKCSHNQLSSVGLEFLSDQSSACKLVQAQETFCIGQSCLRNYALLRVRKCSGFTSYDLRHGSLASRQGENKLLIDKPLMCCAGLERCQSVCITSELRTRLATIELDVHADIRIEPQGHSISSPPFLYPNGNWRKAGIVQLQHVGVFCTIFQNRLE